MALSVKAKKGIVFGIGVGLLFIGCLIGGLWSIIVSSIFDNEMGLTDSSTSFGMWEETPIPMYIEVHMWNWTNAEEFAKFPHNTTPHFVEMGPYVFSEKHYKVNLTWNDNATVTFRQNRVWHFEPDLSNGTLIDEVTNINIIAVTVEYMIRHMNPLVQMIVDSLVKTVEPLYVTKTVGQLMFEGYEDELLNITATLNVSDFKVPFDKFGWFYPRNESMTYDGVFTMHTGTDDIKQLGLMEAWNYEHYPPYYDGECGRIYGSTGELFPPLDDVNSMGLFAPEICSTIKLMRAKDSYSRLGIEAYRFIGDDSSFDNGTKYPDHRCFCAKSPVFGPIDVHSCSEECVPSGVRSISKCRFGAPAFISFPHFYLADSHYTRSVSGLKPDKDKHQFYLAVEPTTGIPLDVKARMQINVLLRQYNNSKLFNDVPRVMLPVLWFTQTAELSEDLADLTKLLVNLNTIGYSTFFGIAGIGLLLIIAGIVITLRNGWKGDEGDKLLMNDSFSPVTPTGRERSANKDEDNDRQ